MEHQAPPPSSPVEGAPEKGRASAPRTFLFQIFALFFIFPVAPRLWAFSMRRPYWNILIFVFSWTVVASMAVAWMVSGAALGWIHDFGKGYDKSWSPLAINEIGELSVLGEHPFRQEILGILVAVDPERDMKLKDGEYPSRVIIGRKYISQEGLFSGQKVEIKKLMDDMGFEKAEISGSSIQAFAETYKDQIFFLVFFLAGLFYLLTGLISPFLYATLAAYFALSFAGRFKGLTYRECHKIALAAVAGKVILSIALAPFFNYRFAFPIYLVAVVAMTLLAISYVPAPVGRSAD